MKQYPQSLSRLSKSASSDTGALPENRGVLILIFGILGLTVFGAFGIPAWIMGNHDLSEIDSGGLDPAGRSLVHAGRICGIIATYLFIFQMTALIVFMFFYLTTRR